MLHPVYLMLCDVGISIQGMHGMFILPRDFAWMQDLAPSGRPKTTRNQVRPIDLFLVVIVRTGCDATEAGMDARVLRFRHVEASGASQRSFKRLEDLVVVVGSEER
jgi:hypothetical protein